MTGQDWPVGTVAVATVRGIGGVRVMRCSAYSDLPWVSAHRSPERDFRHGDRHVTDVRPLIVLDLGGIDVAELLDDLRGGAAALDVADQIEAQTKPPRMAEPGLWGVVSASVRGRGSEGFDFIHSHGVWLGERGGQFTWDELIDPQPVRPGIEDES